jgi:hypothetical protein
MAPVLHTCYGNRHQQRENARLPSPAYAKSGSRLCRSIRIVADVRDQSKVWRGQETFSHWKKLRFPCKHFRGFKDRIDRPKTGNLVVCQAITCPKAPRESFVTHWFKLNSRDLFGHDPLQINDGSRPN